MDSIDLEVLTTAVKWSADGEYTLLATVVRTWGSAPRPVGSMMTIRADGHVRGSISGGCIEDDLIAQVQSGQYHAQTPQVLTYGLSADEAHRFGLPCGGTLQIVVECVTPQSQLAPLLAAIARQGLVTRELDLDSGAATLRAGAHVGALALSRDRLITVHGPRYRLVIIGAGQLTRYVAGMARALDYQVIVCDPRDEFIGEWDVEGVELSREMPDDLILRLQLDSHCAVLALTHDPKLDDMALLEALKSPAFYVGAIGSRSSNLRRRERLALFDVSAAEIARLHGPVGLHLGARTPPEIAISILAEMTALRNGVDVLQTHERRPASTAHDDAVCALPQTT
ncbi:xanthine dehydrogenase accessory factor [Massilia sp. UYP11]|uniref:XdhC family protein n=1 Tax=Massilia sp. UYP11 TaxID=1756385 RepID=UPI003D1ECDE9